MGLSKQAKTPGKKEPEKLRSPPERTQQRPKSLVSYKRRTSFITDKVQGFLAESNMPLCSTPLILTLSYSETNKIILALSKWPIYGVLLQTREVFALQHILETILREKMESTKKKRKEESKMPQINIYREKHLESDWLKNHAYFLHFSYYGVNNERKFISSNGSEEDN